MPVISIITPIHQAGVQYLPSACESLIRQEMPSGWSWEWLIQEDGDEVDAASHVPADTRIRVASSRRGGPHVARTVALGRSAGELIKNLDSDDLLADGSLSRDIRTLEENPDVGWVTSRVLDLLADGSLVGFEGDPPAGRITRGSTFAHWEQEQRPQVHPATLCARRALILALGGWMALPASGDTGLLLGLDAVSDGWFTEEVGLHYRKHPGQITTHASHSAGPEWQDRMTVIREHTRALQKMAWCLPEER
ncbi:MULTISPECIES: glycosyltransferase [Streptomyces]|uniref:glycosyltransferase family 2 protein n=1 Tax=Streptomyces TaxID=1883 RepID=UPI001CCFB82A|nr:MULTISPECIES: glycosyltransferase [Streptomyces]MBZ6204680.1 glycosyltransferase [Streptomyces olivaceus]MBZ6288868.1 glycosyltransferase [Streptomyces olivaceus]WFB88362.1 glycosyltransferase [Streptomyces olivaceus]WGK50803.1 glycosyltransferase [Streptomyces sp. B146]